MTVMDPRLAARRRQVQESRARSSLRRLLWLLVVAIVIAAGVWVVRSPLFSLREIRIRGATEAQVEDMLATTGITRGVPLMDIDVAAAEARLESDPWVIDAVVTKDWPQSLDVAVDERVPVAVARTAESLVVVAVDGTVVSEAIDSTLPVLDVPDRAATTLAGDRSVEGALEFMAALPDPLLIGTVVRFGTDGLEAQVLGYAVRLGSPIDGEAKARALEAVLETVPPQGSVITVMAPDRPAVLPPGASPDAAGQGGEAGDETGQTQDG